MTIPFSIALFGPTGFLIVATILGWLTPGYGNIRQTISELALGKYGRLQELNFFINGGLILTIGCILASQHAPLHQSICIAIMGSIMLLSAFFRTDPVVQEVTSTTTARGAVHMALFIIGMVAMISAQIAWGFHHFGSPMSLYSLLSGIAVPAFFIGVVTQFNRRGLFQRLLLIDIMLWITLFAVMFES